MIRLLRAAYGASPGSTISDDERCGATQRRTRLGQAGSSDGGAVLGYALSQRNIKGLPPLCTGSSENQVLRSFF